MTNLPAEVIERDKKLQRSANELMELRWHWTLDESNAKRVGIKEYARQVGVRHVRVLSDAHGWADWLKAQGGTGTSTAKPGAPQSPNDFRELRQISSERREAAQAIAGITGRGPGSVARNSRPEIDAVVSTARERAAERGTTVEHEIQRAAEWREKARQAAQREQDERRRASTLRFVEIEGHVGVVMQRLRKILDSANDVAFTDEERELITESLGKMRALLGLIDLRITGETQIDWDAELKKLEV